MINTIPNIEDKIKRLFKNKRGRAISTPTDKLDRYYFDELLNEGYLIEFKGKYMISLKGRRLRKTKIINVHEGQKAIGLL